MRHDYTYQGRNDTGQCYMCRRCGAHKVSPATTCPGWPELGTVYWHVSRTEVTLCAAKERGRGDPWNWDPRSCYLTEADARIAWRVQRMAVVAKRLARVEGVDRGLASSRVHLCEQELAAARKALADLDEQIAALRAEAQALEGFTAEEDDFRGGEE